MNRQLAATLICLCCHTGATFASDGARTPAADPQATAISQPQPQPQPQAQASVAVPKTASLISSANAGEATPMVRRAANHADAAPRYATTRVALPDTTASAQRDAAPDHQGSHSSTLWIVGLVLIAGIAMRRWGFERA
jgi:hypothetical protein